MKEIRIGIFGGFRGIAFYSVIAKTEGFSVRAICDANEKTRKELNKRLEMKYRSAKAAEKEKPYTKTNLREVSRFIKWKAERCFARQAVAVWARPVSGTDLPARAER